MFWYSCHLKQRGPRNLRQPTLPRKHNPNAQIMSSCKRQWRQPRWWQSPHRKQLGLRSQRRKAQQNSRLQHALKKGTNMISVAPRLKSLEVATARNKSQQHQRQCARCRQRIGVRSLRSAWTAEKRRHGKTDVYQ